LGGAAGSGTAGIEGTAGVGCHTLATLVVRAAAHKRIRQATEKTRMTYSEGDPQKPYFAAKRASARVASSKN